MWSRNVSVDIMGNQTYTPDQNGVCIAGAKGKDAAIISSTEPSDKSYLWCDTSVSPPLLKRWADTEWVVVNDNALQITEIYNEMTSSINKASDNIMLQVGEKTYSKDEVDKLLAETNTTFEQTKDSFNFEFNRIQSAINDVSNTSDARYEDITKYIRFVDGEIHIGIVGNPIMLRQRNDRISFLENNTEVAYISNRTLYFTHAEVLKDLKIGKFAWLEVMKYDANTVAQIYTTKTGQKYVRYMKNGIWDNNWRGGMSNVEKLWSGTLSKGGKVTIANLDLYDTFILGCSNGTAMLIGTRYYDPSGNRGTTVLFSTAHDDGTSSYVYKATTSMSGTTFTLISASTHTLQNNGNAGSSMSVKSLYGVM